MPQIGESDCWVARQNLGEKQVPAGSAAITVAAVAGSPVRLIVKAHGCVADPARIVLSRSQYFKERQLHAGFYNVLDALFITHTILFVGYSMSDPDIQLVLENSNISATSSHTHYALVEDSIQPDIEDASRRAYNIHFIKYPAGQHQEAARLLADLEEQVTQFRVANPG